MEVKTEGLTKKELKEEPPAKQDKFLLSSNLEVMKSLGRSMTVVTSNVARDSWSIPHLVVSDTTRCNYEVLVMDQFQRTLKLLHTIASGKYVVSSLWLDECERQGRITDYSRYLLDDARQPGLLKASTEKVKSGYKVFAGYRFLIDRDCNFPISTLELVELIYFCGGMTSQEHDIKNSPDLTVIVSEGYKPATGKYSGYKVQTL